MFQGTIANNGVSGAAAPCSYNILTLRDAGPDNVTCVRGLALYSARSRLDFETAVPFLRKYALKEVNILKIKIDEISVSPDRGEADPDEVQELADSMKELGLLTAIAVGDDYTLIAGLHRLEAAKLLGWTEIACVVLDLKGIQAEMAEIDENIVRRNISTIQFGDLLLRRKKLYEELHPETKHGGDHCSQKSKIAKCKLAPVKSFVQDTAEKMGVDPSTVSRQLQVARDMTEEAKEILRKSETKISKKDALQLSKLEAEAQTDAATLLAEGKIKTLDEYQEAGKPQASETVGKPSDAPIVIPLPAEGRKYASFEESVADLKNVDKDCGSTPNGFLVEVSGIIETFLRTMKVYYMDCYQVLFPALTDEQLTYLRQQTDKVCGASHDFYKTVERVRNGGLQQQGNSA